MIAHCQPWTPALPRQLCLGLPHTVFETSHYLVVQKLNSLRNMFVRWQCIRMSGNRIWWWGPHLYKQYLYRQYISLMTLVCIRLWSFYMNIQKLGMTFKNSVCLFWWNSLMRSRKYDHDIPIPAVDFKAGCQDGGRLEANWTIYMYGLTCLDSYRSNGSSLSGFQ